MATSIKPGTSGDKGVTGRKSLSGGGGKFVTRKQKYRQVRAGLGMAGG